MPVSVVHFLREMLIHSSYPEWPENENGQNRGQNSHHSIRIWVYWRSLPWGIRAALKIWRTCHVDETLGFGFYVHKEKLPPKFLVNRIVDSNSTLWALCYSCIRWEGWTRWRANRFTLVILIVWYLLPGGPCWEEFGAHIWLNRKREWWVSSTLDKSGDTAFLTALEIILISSSSITQCQFQITTFNLQIGTPPKTIPHQKGMPY